MKGSSTSSPFGMNEAELEKEKSSAITTSTSAMVDVLLVCICAHERGLTRSGAV